MKMKRLVVRVKRRLSLPRVRPVCNILPVVISRLRRSI